MMFGLPGQGIPDVIANGSHKYRAQTSFLKIGEYTAIFSKAKTNEQEVIMATRREILKFGAMASAGMLVPWQAGSVLNPSSPTKARSLYRDPISLSTLAHRKIHRHNVGVMGVSPGLARYVDALPIPNVIHPVAGQIVNISMSAFRQRLHRDLPATPLWGYQGSYPGPTFDVTGGTPVRVRWSNHLPTTHFLPVDNTVHGAESSVPPVRTVVHLHGQKVLPESDGYPEAWFTSDGRTGPFFNPNPYNYPNDQQATTLWYHDHALGITRLNLYTGLEGFYIIRDSHEASLNLPKGQYEIPLMIQDRLFNPDGSLLYPVAEGGTHPFWIPEFFGDTVLINGKVWPHLDVEPRKYRFRMLNASNARFYHLTLVESDSSGNPNGHSGPVIRQIGTDGGLLPHPVTIPDILIAPAERFDVVIDFSGTFGKTFVFQNDAPAPYPDGDDVVPADVMMFRVVKRLQGRDTSSVPNTLNSVPLISPGSAVKQRNLLLTEADRDPDGFPIIALLDQKMWDDPVSEDPKVNTVEQWNLINTTGDAHPKHIHLVQFQILNRQPFDVDQWSANGQIVFTGPPVTPDANERPAWKDTVKSLPGTVTRLLMQFTLPTGTHVTHGQRFRYVWHCHILEHEDNEMMRPYDVVVP